MQHSNDGALFGETFFCRWTPLVWSCFICSLPRLNRSRFVQACSPAFPRELPNGMFDLDEVCHCRSANSPLPSPVAEQLEPGFPRADYQYGHQVRFHCSKPFLPTQHFCKQISLRQAVSHITTILLLWHAFFPECAAPPPPHPQLPGSACAHCHSAITVIIDAKELRNITAYANDPSGCSPAPATSRGSRHLAARYLSEGTRSPVHDRRAARRAGLGRKPTACTRRCTPATRCRTWW